MRTPILALAVTLAGGIVAGAMPDGRLDALKGLVEAGRYAEAEEGTRVLLAEIEAVGGTDTVEGAAVLDVLVEASWRGGKSREPEVLRYAERAVRIKEQKLGADHPDVARSIHGLAVLLAVKGDYSAARPLFERSVAIREAALGPDHLDVAQSLNGLANLLALVGDHRAARPLHERALAIRENALGPEHREVASSLQNLANVEGQTGDYVAARQHFARALAILEKTLGPDHEQLGGSLHNLATVLLALAEFSSARPLLERALTIAETALGPDHPEVALSLASLGSLLQKMGDLAGARRFQERALAIRERALGPDHRYTIESLNALGSVLQDAGDFAAARASYERAVAAAERALGPEHPHVAASLNNLALLLELTADYRAARPLFERALALRERALGPAHADVAQSLACLGDLLRETGEYSAARPLLERALAIRERAFGPEHPAVAASLTTLARLHATAGQLTAARALAERALALMEAVFGPQHPEIASSLTILAQLRAEAGEYSGGRELLERALALREATFGGGHPAVAESLSNLARLLVRMGEHAAARSLLERALAIDTRALGPDHFHLAQGLETLAGLLAELAEHGAARPLLERALALEQQVLGPDHPIVARSLGNLGALLLKTGDRAAARALLERALSIEEKALGADHFTVAESLRQLATLDLGDGKHAAALPVLERALAIEELALGGDNPAVAATLSSIGYARLKAGERAAARSAFERALAIKEKVLGSDHPDVADSLTDVAIVLVLTGEAAAARPMVERALGINRQAYGPDHPAVSQSLRILAWLQALMGASGDALEASLAAEGVARGHLRLACRSLSERQALQYAVVQATGLDLALTLAAGGRLEGGALRQVLDAVVRSRGVVLDEIAARQRAVRGTGSAEVDREAAALASARARLANLMVRGRGQEEPSNYRALLDQARKETEQAERALAAASTGFARELTRARVGLDDVVASLPPESALVAFVQYQKLDLATASNPARPSYLALVLRPGESDPRVVAIGATREIDGLVSRWRREIEQNGATRLPAATLLRQAIWDPVAFVAGNASRVFVVPDGAMNLVNFAVLPTAAGKFLIEQGPLLHYVTTERDLVEIRDAPRAQGLLAIGGPSYDAKAPFGSLRGSARAPGKRGSACGDFASLRFEPLPAAQQEAREIVRLWKRAGTDPLAVLDLGASAASETEVKRAAPGRRVLHLATHGFFLAGVCDSAMDSARGIGGLVETSVAAASRPPAVVSGESPLVLSGLALAGANHRAAAGAGEDDGILTAEEIASLDLTGMEWAVLSACETGIGDVRAGEGVFGLRRAFQIAGAATLIMSLWSVDDESTRTWMKALYEGRLARGLSTAEAVRDASLAVLERRRAAGESSHPFYWGAFIAAGDWR